MNCRRVHILGGSGSGKSHVARKLADAYGIEVLDLDTIFWDNASGEYNRRADDETRDRALKEFINRDAWIVEGVYHTWLTPSFRAADVIIILATPVWLRQWRIVRRFAARKMGLAPAKGNETLASLWGLLRWNRAYDGDNLARARAMIAGLGLSAVECASLSEVMKAMGE